MTSKQVKKLLIRSSLDETLILDPEVPTFFSNSIISQSLNSNSFLRLRPRSSEMDIRDQQ
jgi:hypothetical protein